MIRCSSLEQCQSRSNNNNNYISPHTFPQAIGFRPGDPVFLIATIEAPRRNLRSASAQVKTGHAGTILEKLPSDGSGVRYRVEFEGADPDKEQIWGEEDLEMAQ